MTCLVSWPMYAVDPAAVAEFWSRLRQALAAAGFDDLPADLAMPDDLVAHWRDPRLLLSQTCGFPFVTSLAGHVRYVATPRFTAPGCEGACYRSAVVVRCDEPAQTLADMRGRRVAFNSRDSQSGYNGLRTLVAPLAREGRFFGGTLETGAHRHSIRAVLSGAADIAAIDAVTLALLTDHAPEAVKGLRVLDHTALVPGLPFVTAVHTTDADLACLRKALAAACTGDAESTQKLRLDGVEVMPTSRYNILLAQRDVAQGVGYLDIA